MTCSPIPDAELGFPNERRDGHAWNFRRQLRKQRGLSQDEVAAAVAARTGAHCTRQWISTLEKDRAERVSAEMLEALAGLFDRWPGYFFADEKTQRLNAHMELVLALAELQDAGAESVAFREFAASSGADEVLNLAAQLREVRAALEADATAPGITVVRARDHE